MITVVNVSTREITQRERTQEEIDNVPPPPPPPPIRVQIDTLERDSQLPKAVRKFMLTAMETEAIKQGTSQGLTAEQSLALLMQGNPGYAAVKALDNQIEALEALL